MRLGGWAKSGYFLFCLLPVRRMIYFPLCIMLAYFMLTSIESFWDIYIPSQAGVLICFFVHQATGKWLSTFKTKERLLFPKVVDNSTYRFFLQARTR